MSYKIYFLRSILLLLFLSAYQTITVHSAYHFIEEVKECNVCELSKELESNSHQTFFSTTSSIVAIRTNELIEKKATRVKFYLAQPPICKSVDFAGLKQFVLKAPTLTYYALAPPYIFS